MGQCVLCEAVRYRLRWLFVRPWQLWCGVAALGVAWPLVSNNKELPILAYGYALQLIGLFTAARAINSNERLFALPRLRERVRQWWTDRSPRVQSVEVNPARGMAFGTASFASRRGRTEGADLAQDVDYLWFNFTELDKEVRALDLEFSRKVTDLGASLSRERAERLSHAARIEETLKQAAISSPLTAYFGIYLAIVGSALTTFAGVLVSKVS